MMSLGTRVELAARLLANGWPGDTPAAAILGAATPQAWTWKGPLDELAGLEVPADRTDLPGTIVVGHVAGLPLTPSASDDLLDLDPFGLIATATAGETTPF